MRAYTHDDGMINEENKPLEVIAPSVHPNPLRKQSQPCYFELVTDALSLDQLLLIAARRY